MWDGCRTTTKKNERRGNGRASLRGYPVIGLLNYNLGRAYNLLVEQLNHVYAVEVAYVY